MIRRKFTPLASLLFLPALVVSASVHGQNCSQCPNALSPTILQGGCEWRLSSETCQATLGPIVQTPGAPGAPAPVAAIECDACSSDVDQQAILNYSQTSGWSWCVTMGGGVTWIVPIGPQWSVQASTTLCFSGTTTMGVSVPVNCPARTRVLATAWETITPVTLSITTFLDKVGTYTLQSGGGACAATLTRTVPCDNPVTNVVVNSYSYLVVFTTLQCPTPAPGGGNP